jgi:hypothetical protein
MLGSIGHGAEAKNKNKNSKRKRHKKRCKKLGAECQQGGKRKCCGDLRCAVSSLDAGIHTFCCKSEGKPCESEFDCCDPFFCCGVPGQEVCSTQCVSDRALKANVAPIDTADILTRVEILPISTWNYTFDEPAVRHVGPMAQDFAAAFGVGADDRHIHPIDGQGVALAAIQGLAVELERLRADNAALSSRVAALENTAVARRPVALGDRLPATDS